MARRRSRKMRDVGIGEGDGAFQLVRELAEPGAEHEGSIEAAVEPARSDKRKGSFGEIVHRVPVGRASSIMIRSIGSPAARLSGPKEKGNSSSRAKLRRTPSGPATWMRVSRGGELADALAAAAARCGEVLPIPTIRMRGDPALATATIAATAAVSAQGPRIGGVLDVAAGETLPSSARRRAPTLKRE